MLMVCPNCQADDSVVISGQNFCLNCGFLIPEKARSTKEAVGRVVPKATDPSTDTTAHTTKRGESQATLEPKLPTKQRSTQPTRKLPLGVPRPNPTIDLSQMPVSGIDQDLATQQTPKPTAVSIAVSPPYAQATMPLASRSAVTLGLPAAVLRMIDPGRVRPERLALGAQSQLPPLPMVPVDAHNAAVVTAASPTGHRYGLLANVVISLPVVLWLVCHLMGLSSAEHFPSEAFALRVWSLFTKSSGLFGRLGLTGFLAVLAYVVLGIVVKLLAMAALAHGYSRKQDARSTHPSSWSLAAATSLPSLLVMIGFVSIVITVLSLVLGFVFIQAPNLLSVGWVLLVIRLLTLTVWLLLSASIIIRTIYACLAIVLGALSPMTAWKLSSRLFGAERLRSIGCLLLSLLVVLSSTLITLGLVVLIAAGLTRLFDKTTYASLLVFISFLAVGLVYHYVLGYLLGIWLHQYRDSIARHYPDMLAACTLGRTSAEGSAIPAVITVSSLLIIVLSGGALYWMLGGWKVLGALSASAWWFTWR
jgi:hypothetical protein